MKILAMSDMHGQLPTIEPCDILLLAGDYCPFGRQEPYKNFYWLKYEFKPWLESIPANRVIGIAGNHDIPFEKIPHKVKELDLKWDYLEESSTTIKCGDHTINVYGTPYSVETYSKWAFTKSDASLAGVWNNIPEDTNLLLVHGPAKYCLDMVLSREHVGSQTLDWRVKQLPRLSIMIHGHIHEAHGRDTLFNTTVFNVSMMDAYYKMVNEPTKLVLKDNRMGAQFLYD